MRSAILAFSLLLCLCGASSAQWVEVTTITREGHREIGSGVIVGDTDGKPVIAGCAHQFRDAVGVIRIDGKYTAKLIDKSLGNGTDYSILQMEQRVANVRAAVIGRTPTSRTEIQIYRGSEVRRGIWAPQMNLDGDSNTLTTMTTTGGMLMAPVQGVVSGWSGGPVYDGDMRLIGIVCAADEGIVVWTPIERVVKTAQVQSGKTVVYVAVSEGCPPCKKFKTDYAAGRLRREGVEYRVVRYESNEFRELTQRVNSAGYRAPQNFPWFFAPRCNCQPRVGYQGPLSLLNWLPPALRPVQPQRFRRTPAPQLPAMVQAPEPQRPAAVPKFEPVAQLPIDPVPDPRIDDILKRLDDVKGSAGHYADLKAHFDKRIAEIRADSAPTEPEPVVVPAEPETAEPEPGFRERATDFLQGAGELAADVAASAAEGSPAVSAGPLDPLIYAATGGTGVAVVWGIRAAMALRRRRKERKASDESGRSGKQPESFPVLHDRDKEEARQIVRLGQLEGRDPLLDSIMGVTFDDTLSRDLANEKMPEALKQYAKSLRAEVKERVDAAAPLSTGKPYSDDWRHEA